MDGARAPARSAHLNQLTLLQRAGRGYHEAARQTLRERFGNVVVFDCHPLPEYRSCIVVAQSLPSRGY